MATMTNENRQLTIASNGEIVPKPYGPGRWHSPRKYGCAHENCENSAGILRAKGTHEISEGVDKAHNCCGSH